MTDTTSRARRRGLRVFPRRDEWRAVAKRWAIAAAVVATGAAVAWFVMLRMPGARHTGPLPPLDAEGAAIRTEVESDVRMLAATIGERNVGHPKKLEEAARHIESAFAACGLAPRRQTFDCLGKPCANLVAEIAGGARRSEIVVVGAHYDSVEGCPGANDNATGAAALLALARRFAATKPARTLRFVAFVNEEPPWFQTDRMGSVVYAKSCKTAGDDVRAMMSLETLGCYSDEPDSQKYPAPGLSLAYGSRGDFIAFVGDVSSRALVREAVGAFRAHCPFPAVGSALPSIIPGVGWSDQWSFWREGYRGVMVTDTAPFRYAWYHTARDTPDKVDFERVARVTSGLAAVVERWANPAE
jgi:hypothetical protein